MMKGKEPTTININQNREKEVRSEKREQETRNEKRERRNEKQEK